MSERLDEIERAQADLRAYVEERMGESRRYSDRLNRALDQVERYQDKIDAVRELRDDCRFRGHEFPNLDAVADRLTQILKEPAPPDNPPREDS